MRNVNGGRKRSSQLGHKYALLTAAAATVWAGSTFGQATLTYDSSKGTAWDLTTADWYQTAGTDEAWIQGSIADLTSSSTTGPVITVGAGISVSGITFAGTFGAKDAAGTPNVVAGAGGYFDLGSNSTFTITQNTSNHEFITVPIHGTNDNIDINVSTTSADTGAIVLAGDMSAFTGNITLANTYTAAPTSSTGASLHIDTNVSGGTINLDEYTSLSNSSQITGGGTTGDPWTGATGKSPNYYTIADNIVLNYNAANENGATNVTNNIGGSNGPTGTSKIEVFSGVISSPTGTTKDGLNIVSNLIIGGVGVRGTVVLANHETYNGSTTVSMSDASNTFNGMAQFAYENALPATTALIIGSGSGVVGVTDLDGYDETVASLSTGTTSPTAANVGNIYNLSVNDSALSFQQNTNNGGVQNPAKQFVALTISPSATTNTIFNGDIGDSSTAINPLNDNAPYNGNTTANRNIALVINGPSGGGTHMFALAPLGSNGDEYTGPTTVNANATLVLGRTSTGTSGAAYTITGNGNITVGSGASLASTATTSGKYAGGAAGTIILQKGSSFLPGEGVIGTSTTALSTSNTGTLSTSNIEWDSGATMTFGLEGTSSYDSVNLINSDNSTGTLTLANPTNDASPSYTINIDGGFLVPGTYPLITGNISGDQTNADHTSQLITLNTTGIGPGQYKLLDLGNSLDLQVSGTALVLQWDPSGGGTAGGYDGDVYEEGGTWADGSTFLNLNNGSEVHWNNSSYLAYDVLIGNDRMQAGGTITLGENIIIGGALRFGPIYPGAVSDDYYYTISDGGSGHTLTLMNGVIVNTAGSTALGAPSAVIAAPIILGANQNWEIDPSEYLDVEGSINDNGAGYTMTVVGAANSTSGGTLFLNAPGSFAGLTVDGGTVLLGNAGAIGNALISLNGGGLQYGVSATVNNNIALGSGGGYLGATQQSGGGAAYNVTFTKPVTGGNALTLVGAGNLTFSSGITASALTVNTSNTAGYGAVVLNGNNTLAALNIPVGNVTIGAGTTNTLGAINVSGGTLALNGTNTISSLTISSGMVTVSSPAALDNVDNPPINLGSITGTTGGTLSIPGFSTLADNINIGTNGQASEYLQDTVAVALTGNISGSGNIHLIGPDFTLSGNSTNTNSTDFDTENMTVHATSAAAFGTSTLLANADATVDVQTNVNANDIRGAKTTATTPTTLTKTGPGTLTLTGTATTASLAGSAVMINQGELVMEQYQELMSSATNAASLNITVNSGATLAADFNNGSTRTRGAVTLNSGTLIHDAASTGDSYFAAGSASDVWTISGNSKIDEATNGATTPSVLRINNPVLVNSGAVLTIESDDTTDNVSDDALVFSGPGNLTDTDPNLMTTPDTYNTFTISPGATVVETGPGNVRFGRTGSQGIAIIGQGTSNSSLPNNGESVMKLGSNFFMTDTAPANNMVTTLVVDGSGAEGLRIEAAMNATYSSSSTGTTGLFGTDSFSPTNGNVYTVLSPNRAKALSSPYNYENMSNTITSSITPGGTLTLAANDAGDATGLINAGPATVTSGTQPSVSLALDNTAGSGGTHIYQIDPSSPAGGSFANFAGLTVERTYAAGAAVTAQLLGNTKVPALSITGGAKLDITNQALVIDPATGATTTQIAGYLQTAYDHGNWDGPGIGSSSIAAQAGTSIGYVENDLLPADEQYSATNLFGGPSGQPVDADAVLVRYTWLGDLNLDGVVNSEDRTMMGALGNGNVGWIGGDLNYDGKVNADDYSLFQLGAAEQIGMLTSAVPEPSAMALLAGAAVLLRRRRKALA